jgi:hypothetical protein
MRGVTILKNEKNNRKIVQFDVREIAKAPAKFEEFIDVLKAEERIQEKDISWETVKAQLKKSGKLK